MFIIYGLLVFFLFESKVLSLLLLSLYIYICKDKRNKLELILLLSLVVLISLSHSYQPQSHNYSARVVGINDYSYTVQGFAYKARIKKDEDLRLGDKIKFTAIKNKDVASNYNRNLGLLEKVEILSKTEKFSIKRFINENFPEQYELLYKGEYESITDSLGLQILGLFTLYKLIMERLFSKAYFKYSFLYLLSCLFSRNFMWWKTLFKELGFSKNVQIVLLLFIFPDAIKSPSFIYSYSLYLISSFNNKNEEQLNPKLLFGQFSLYFFNEWNILQSIYYPYLKYVSALKVIFILLSTCIPSSMRLSKSLYQLISQYNSSSIYRLMTVRGNYPFLFFLFIILLRNRKEHLVFFTLSLIFVIYPPYARVSYVDVGQGDASIVSLPFNRKHYLIDTGRKFAYPQLKKNLKHHGIFALDYLILSHDDLDHVENKERIISDFQVKNIVDKKTQKVQFAQQHLVDYEFADENENSLILSFSIHGNNYLFLGDASKRQEKLLVKEIEKINFLKLAHHGSKTSSSDELLSLESIKLGIISSDPRIYKHPSPEVMRSLYNHSILPLETSRLGDIRIISFPYLQYLKTSQFYFAIIQIGD